MVHTNYVADPGLRLRMIAVLLLIGGILVTLVAAIIFWVDPAYAPVVVLIALAIVLYQWWSSDRVAMRAMRAREVSPQEAPELHAMVDRLCHQAELPKPRVGIADLSVPNAFATGRSPQHAVVCVTTGILQVLNTEELEAVLAHELSHVANRDVTVMTVASASGIVASMLARGAQFGSFGVGRQNRNSGGAPAFLVALLLSWAVYLITFLALRLLSRYRELSADRSGAYLTGKPTVLASALQKISGAMARAPQNELAGAAVVNALCIAPSIAGLDWRSLTSTHPSLAERLEQLAQIAQEMGPGH
jgi:heat shock protein HtpX